MTYITTVTSKGQITIPKAFRDKLQLEKIKRVLVEMETSEQRLIIKPASDLYEIIKNIKPPKHRKNVLLAREYMEKNYERL